MKRFFDILHALAFRPWLDEDAMPAGTELHRGIQGDRFSIITLVFSDSTGQKGVVPELLHSYVWKGPSTELEALREIIRALPIRLGPPSWVEGV